MKKVLKGFAIFVATLLAVAAGALLYIDRAGIPRYAPGGKRDRLPPLGRPARPSGQGEAAAEPAEPLDEGPLSRGDDLFEQRACVSRTGGDSAGS